MQEGAYPYVVRCSDGSFYTGTTRTALEARISQHNDGTFKGYTETRRPVALVFSEWFDRITDAIDNERKLKGWSRAKKDAFIRGDLRSLRQLSKRRSPHPSRRLLRSLLRMRDSASPVTTARSAETSGQPCGSACRRPRGPTDWPVTGPAQARSWQVLCPTSAAAPFSSSARR